MRGGRLRWHGRVERKDDGDYAKASTMSVVEMKVPVGRGRKTWQITPSADMSLLKVDLQDRNDRNKGRVHRMA